jgi:integrase
MFLSVKGTALAYTTVNCTFRRILQLANIAPGRTRRPRIHDLRHTFATRVLEQCGSDRDAVARHFVALATYKRDWETVLRNMKIILSESRPPTRPVP